MEATTSALTPQLDVFTRLGSYIPLPVILVFLFLWTFIWKAMALWRSARKGHLFWFVILLLVSTFGLLDIAYYYYLSRYDWNSLPEKLGLTAYADKLRDKIKASKK
ncbi:hypothetical protein IJJ27_03295 [bacterium]|nr:hypothetical protein [bacterium]MBQ6436559.1 hypothetical protein [bacterium]